MKEYKIGSTTVFSFDWTYISSHCYMIAGEKNVILIDPVLTDETEKAFKSISEKHIHVILTHEHFDHINGVPLLRKICTAAVYCNNVCSEKIKMPSKNLSDKADVIAMFDKTAVHGNVQPFCCEADICFENEYSFSVGGHFIKMITTPGHTDGSICVILDNELLFSGDSLLDTPTITRLPGGSKKDFQNITLPFFRSLTENIRMVFPGHGSPGTMEQLLKINT